MVSLLCAVGSQMNKTEPLRYRFASQEEGRQLKMASTAYLDAQTQNGHRLETGLFRQIARGVQGHL